MRVLQLGPFPPPNGGVQTNLKAIHDLLIKRGHKASAIAITKSSQTAGVADVYKPNSIFELLKLLFTLKFDIVHLHLGGNLNLRLTGLMWVCGWLPNCRAVVTFHSGGYAKKAVNFAKPFSLRGFAFRSLDFVIGVNAQMLEMFRKFGVSENRMKLVLPFVLQKPDPQIEIPVELENFLNRHQPFLLTVGLLEEEYALSLQIEVLEQVLAEFPQAGLMILGSGSLENDLRELIRSKKYADNILLTGDIPHEITLSLIEKADVLLRPTFFDGDAVSVREALFLQTPVIATDNGMRPANVNLISMPPNLAELAEKIIEVLGKKNEKTPVDDVEGRKNIEQILEIYEKLL